jgi:hypothetical protein
MPGYGPLAPEQIRQLLARYGDRATTIARARNHPVHGEDVRATLHAQTLESMSGSMGSAMRKAGIEHDLWTMIWVVYLDDEAAEVATPDLVELSRSNGAVSPGPRPTGYNSRALSGPAEALTDGTAPLRVHRDSGFPRADATRLERLLRAGLVRANGAGRVEVTPGQVWTEPSPDGDQVIYLRWRPSSLSGWLDPVEVDPNTRRR